MRIRRKLREKEDENTNLRQQVAKLEATEVRLSALYTKNQIIQKN